MERKMFHVEHFVGGIDRFCVSRETTCGGEEKEMTAGRRIPAALHKKKTAGVSRETRCAFSEKLFRRRVFETLPQSKFRSGEHSGRKCFP
jgi:hypothetical protein